MIKIHKSKTADTRTCNFTKVTEDQLIDSTYQINPEACADTDASSFPVSIDMKVTD